MFINEFRFPKDVYQEFFFLLLQTRAKLTQTTSTKKECPDIGQVAVGKAWSIGPHPVPETWLCLCLSSAFCGVFLQLSLSPHGVKCGSRSRCPSFAPHSRGRRGAPLVAPLMVRGSLSSLKPQHTPHISLVKLGCGPIPEPMTAREVGHTEGGAGSRRKGARKGEWGEGGNTRTVCCGHCRKPVSSGRARGGKPPGT